MKARFRSAAFTLVELVITTAVSAVLGGLLYTVASENLNSFSRNASINRAYMDARASLDRISALIDMAGQLPELLDTDGTIPTTTPPPFSYPGVRFYSTGTLPSYQIPSGTTATKTLVVNLTPYQMNSRTGCPIAVGDLATIPLIGFQDTVTAVSTVTSIGSNYSRVTLTFATAINTSCSPALATKTVGGKTTTVDTDFTPSGTTYYTCVVYRQAAFIAVPKATGGAQLRYYPKAMSAVSTGTACGGLSDFNNAAAFNNPANYKVIDNLYGGTVTPPVGEDAVNPLAPFRLLQTNGGWTLVTDLCSEGPDYNNRNFSLSNTFTLVRSSVGPRSPSTLHSLYN